MALLYPHASFSRQSRHGSGQPLVHSHLRVDGVGFQRSDGLVEERQVGQAAVVAARGVVGGPPAQHDGPRQVHRSPTIIVQQRAVAACDISTSGMFMLAVAVGFLGVKWPPGRSA